MASLIDDLQRDALDNDVDVATLLRKALVVASRLNLVEFEQWVRYELFGYRGVAVPLYRQIRGRVLVNDGIHRPMPMAFESSDTEDLVSTHHLQSPIGPTADLVRDATRSSKFQVDLSAEMQQLLMKPFPGMRGIPFLVYDRSHIVLVVDAVRNEILDWSIKLYRDGIRGEGMTFSTYEIAKAEQHRPNFMPPITINISNMVGSSLQVSSPGANNTHSIQG